MSTQSIYTENEQYKYKYIQELTLSAIPCFQLIFLVKAKWFRLN